MRNAMAVVRHDAIADHFKQQQHRDRVDQKHGQRPGRLPPQKVIDAERACVNTAFARNNLQRPRAFFVIDPESHQFAFVKHLIWLDGELMIAIHPPCEFGRPRADAAVAVEEQIIMARFDPHILTPFRTTTADPSATKADPGFALRHSTSSWPYTRFTSQSKAASLVCHTRQGGCST